MDLNDEYSVQQVRVRPRDPQVLEQWVTSFKLALSLNGTTFDVIRTHFNMEHIFKGPTHATDDVTVTFNTTTARFVRLIALTWTLHISARWEVYACLEGNVHEKDFGSPYGYTADSKTIYRFCSAKTTLYMYVVANPCCFRLFRADFNCSSLPTGQLEHSKLRIIFHRFLASKFLPRRRQLLATGHHR